MTALREFLKRNQISEARPLPIVHSTEAYFLKKIIETGKIEATPCDVFAGERLSYFFVGRPAYKRALNSEPEYWQLPVCFVFEFFIEGARRIFPFDSGAFKGGRFPRYINMMDLNDFEVNGDEKAPQKIIGTFFSTSQNYFKLIPRPKEFFEATFGVELLDEEIKALHRLILENNKKFDDRRFAIEMSFDNDIALSKRKLLGVVIPETYASDEVFFNKIKSTGAEVMTYPLYPLRKNYFYYAIYTKLDEFYKRINAYAI